MRKFFPIAIACAALGAGAMALIPTEEEAALTPEQERYCEEVSKWRAQEGLGVDPNVIATGHPDTHGTYSQWCLEP